MVDSFAVRYNDGNNLMNCDFPRELLTLFPHIRWWLTQFKSSLLQVLLFCSVYCLERTFLFRSLCCSSFLLTLRSPYDPINQLSSVRLLLLFCVCVLITLHYYGQGRFSHTTYGRLSSGPDSYKRHFSHIRSRSRSLQLLA